MLMCKRDYAHSLPGRGPWPGLAYQCCAASCYKFLTAGCRCSFSNGSSLFSANCVGLRGRGAFGTLKMSDSFLAERKGMKELFACPHHL